MVVTVVMGIITGDLRLVTGELSDWHGIHEQDERGDQRNIVNVK